LTAGARLQRHQPRIERPPENPHDRARRRDGGRNPPGPGGGDQPRFGPAVGVLNPAHVPPGASVIKAVRVVMRLELDGHDQPARVRVQDLQAARARRRRGGQRSTGVIGRDVQGRQGRLRVERRFPVPDLGLVRREPNTPDRFRIAALHPADFRNGGQDAARQGRDEALRSAGSVWADKCPRLVRGILTLGATHERSSPPRPRSPAAAEPPLGNGVVVWGCPPVGNASRWRPAVSTTLSTPRRGHNKSAQGRASRRQPQSDALGTASIQHGSPERAKQIGSSHTHRSLDAVRLVSPLQGWCSPSFITQGGATRLRRSALPWAAMWLPLRATLYGIFSWEN
jgi:hypothetical protein